MKITFSAPASQQSELASLLKQHKGCRVSLTLRGDQIYAELETTPLKLVDTGETLEDALLRHVA